MKQIARGQCTKDVQPRPACRRALRAVLASLVWVAALVATGAEAASLPRAGRVVTLTAREQPVTAFLQDLFATMDVPAAIAPGLTGAVNGTFSGPAAKVLRDVARVYNLVTYYDGSVMHVVPAFDLVRRTFPVTPAAAERLLRDASDLDLTDTRNTLRRATGGLVAVGARRFVEQVDELLRAAEAPQAQGTPIPNGDAADFRVFYLRYAWAQDTTMTVGGRQIVVPGVASILRSLVDSRAPAGPLGREVMLRPTLPSLRGQGLAGQGVANKPPSADEVRGQQVDMLVGALARTAQPGEAAPAVPTGTPAAVQVRIEADQRLNAVIVRDTVERLPRYEQLIASLDVEPQSLEIEATIIDVNVDKARDLGINWRWSNDGRSAAFGGATPLPGAAGVASVVLGSVGQFFARIRALQSEGAARVVSSPQVVTLSNVEAIFDNSSTFYVRVAGRNDVDLFNVSAGTSLRVTPHVFRDSAQTRIKLLVNVEDGNISGRQVDQIPVVERSTINTQALIAEGESLLIGGMVRETTSQSVDKVPGLGDVPVLGHLFKNTNSGTVRVERMFLITPRLAGTRTAPPQTTLGVQRAGATPLDGVREPLPVGRAATAAPARMPLPLAPVAPMPLAPATPLPAPGPRQATAPAAVVAPKPRSSAVIDLDALPRGAPAAAPSRPAPAGTGPIAYRTALTQR